MEYELTVKKIEEKTVTTKKKKRAKQHRLELEDEEFGEPRITVVQAVPFGALSVGDLLTIRIDNPQTTLDNGD